MESGKFFLKGTSKLSLNDRFTKLIKARPQALSQQPAVQKKPSPAAQANKSSARNRRLALQMENRPAVRAALGIEQRLGAKPKRGTVKNRLGQVRGRARGRLATRGAASQRGAVQRGRANYRGSLRGVRRGGVTKSYVAGTSQRGRVQRGRGNLRRGRGNRGNLQNTRVQRVQNTATRGARGARGRGRGRGTGRGRGRGRGRGGAAIPSVSKEDLDDQLDAYMANTRGSLDAELDAYMADTTQ